jgi:hypothetical protein
MKNKMLMLMAVMAAAGPAWAQSPKAVIQSLSGTVEIKAPGSAAWISASPGQELDPDTAVSTGFRSAALIRLGDSSLTVRPLTRLTVKELAAAGDTDRVDIQLRAGRVRAEVKAPEGGRNVNFTVRGPSATASVRGTVFDFDTVNLSVDEGTVAFSGADNTAVYVAAGQSSSPDPVSGKAAAAVETAAALTPAPPAGVEDIAPVPPAVIFGPAAEAPVNVGINWPD